MRPMALHVKDPWGERRTGACPGFCACGAWRILAGLDIGMARMPSSTTSTPDTSNCRGT
jgi:hypothetical protein